MTNELDYQDLAMRSTLNFLALIETGDVAILSA